MAMLRIATFNAENLFSRPRAMLHTTWAAGKQVLEDFAEMARLIEEPTYTATTKSRLRTLLDRQVYNKPAGQRAIKLNEARGKLAKRVGTTTTIVANGRGDWVGWFELIRDELKGVEVVNTGRVINAVRPDILCLVEVEDRPSLARFNDQVLQYEFQYPFRQHMLVDGNDERGIDISLVSQRTILGVRSYTDVPRPGKTEPVFSRDCPEYTVDLGGGQTLIVLGNHFKSQGYGNKASNDAKRLDQANAVKTIYQAALQRTQFVVVAGDLNAGPNDASVAPIVKNAGCEFRPNSRTTLRSTARSRRGTALLRPADCMRGARQRPDRVRAEGEPPYRQPAPTLWAPQAFRFAPKGTARARPSVHDARPTRSRGDSDCRQRDPLSGEGLVHPTSLPETDRQ